MLVQLVIAAMTTAPCSSWNVSPSSVTLTEAGAGDRRRDGHALRRHRLVAGLDAGRRVARREGLGDGLVERLLAVADAEAREGLDEGAARACERHPVLWAARTGEARFDVTQVELDDLRVRRLVVRVVEEVLLARVGLDEGDPLLWSRGERQVAKRLLVDREEVAGGPALGRHVGDRRAIGDRQADEAAAEELDELADDADAAEDLRDREDEIGRRRSGRERSRELEADDLRNEHRDRLAEHRRLGLDPAHAPAEHAEPVHHRRVGVRADQRVRERLPAAADLPRLDHPRQVLDVDLVDDAGLRRDDAEVLEGRLSPAQERVALPVALELELGVAGEGETLRRTRPPAPSGR